MREFLHDLGPGHPFDVVATAVVVEGRFGSRLVAHLREYGGAGDRGAGGQLAGTLPSDSDAVLVGGRGDPAGHEIIGGFREDLFDSGVRRGSAGIQAEPGGVARGHPRRRVAVLEVLSVVEREQGDREHLGEGVVAAGDLGVRPIRVPGQGAAGGPEGSDLDIGVAERCAALGRPVVLAAGEHVERSRDGFSPAIPSGFAVPGAVVEVLVVVGDLVAAVEPVDGDAEVVVGVGGGGVVAGVVVVGAADDAEPRGVGLDGGVGVGGVGLALDVGVVVVDVAGPRGAARVR